MEHAARGANALEVSDNLAAVTHYTKALIENPTSPDYFTQRSTAFARLKPARHDLALRDAEYAVLLGQKRGKREKIQAAQQRRVVSLYGLGQFEESKRVLESMLRWRPKDSKKDKMEYDMWMARITSRLKGKETTNHTTDIVKEYPEVALPNEKEMVAWLKSQLKQDSTFRFDEDATAADNPASVANNGSTTDSDVQDKQDSQVTKSETTAPTVSQQAVPKVQPIRHDWYQDNNLVTVTFYAKKVDKTKLISNFTEDLVEISFPHPESSEQTFSFSLDPTFAGIDPSSTVIKAFGTKVELKLAKAEKGIKWPALDNKDRPKADKLPSAWTTKGNQDWDKKAEEITKKQSKKKGKKSDGADSDNDADSDAGGDAVDGFFKKLYAGADEDTRRAMMKSFQESNGTALSTNWEEVSKAKVEEVKGKDS